MTILGERQDTFSDFTPVLWEDNSKYLSLPRHILKTQDLRFEQYISPSLLGSVKVLIPYKDFPLSSHRINPGLTSNGRTPSLSEQFFLRGKILSSSVSRSNMTITVWCLPTSCSPKSSINLNSWPFTVASFFSGSNESKWEIKSMLAHFSLV